MVSLVAISQLQKTNGYKKGAKNVQRVWRPVESMFKELGPLETCCSYGMYEESFWRLHRLLYKTDGNALSKDGKSPPNGEITSSARLSMALRWMAGGSKHGIAVSHGVGKRQVLESVWNIVDLVNFSDDPSLQMKFPSTHAKQLEIAKGFGVCILQC